MLPCLGLGFRLRRSLRLGKLARINLSTRGASLSLGVPGARLNVGTRGTRVTAGLPGTGLSYTTRLDGSGGNYGQPASSSSSGCLAALGYFILITFLFSVTVGIASDSPMGAVVFVSIVVVIWVLIARAARKAREARIAAQHAEWQRQQHEQWAQHQAQLAAQAAEHERQRAFQAAQHEAERQQRWARLVATYGETDARRIWTGRPWVGCPAEMLVEMLGHPEDIDTKVLKTKTKETYKYRHQGGNRYGLRVTLDDGKVVGWDERD